MIQLINNTRNAAPALSRTSRRKDARDTGLVMFSSLDTPEP